MRYAVVLGEALIDLLDGECDGEPVYRQVIGGAPLNVAVGVARLGGTVEFAGALGDDALAERIRRFLRTAGVGDRALTTVAAPTTLAVATFTGAEPDFRFYGDPPSYGLLDPAHLDARLIADATVLYCGSIALLTEPTLTAARQAWAGTGGLRVFDPNVRPRLLPDAASLAAYRQVVAGFAATADLVKLSAADAEVLYDGADPVAAAALLHDLGTATVVVTRGAAGALVSAGGDVATIDAPTVAAVDATGAGDSVMGALIAELLDTGMPADTAGWADRVGFALRVAGLVCESPGGAVAMPTRAAVAARFS
ncbi:carbohydrate kinase [Solwaraspora sp. WMMD791]|uniref:carbohydrate kinase family protein n=1 Tax=Solwaraspora sp. WMMD791 TaxID=3016086 RepID=UPI002499DA62|nr:carbohydrate kinase [Solwaraspora sp. WMMD791]WFE27925.1 carbohydrate kinase [Solwaraspora sp. WMMD791]